MENFFETGLPRLFDDSFWNNGNQRVGGGVPVNIRETDNGFEVELVAPGLKKEDFKVTMDRGLLTVSFEHQEQAEQKEEGKWLRNEYRSQSFSRSFTIGDGVDTSNINARYIDGVLHLSLPKKEELKQPVQQITVE
jgi:HSP20 family protein